MTTKTETSKPRSKPGFKSKYIDIPEAAWEKITAHVDANCLDLDKWLTKQFTEIAAQLAKKEA
jgi:hypothetical protein